MKKLVMVVDAQSSCLNFAKSVGNILGIFCLTVPFWQLPSVAAVVASGGTKEQVVEAAVFDLKQELERQKDKLQIAPEQIELKIGTRAGSGNPKDCNGTQNNEDDFQYGEQVAKALTAENVEFKVSVFEELPGSSPLANLSCKTNLAVSLIQTRLS